jgi:hypothetical protein
VEDPYVIVSLSRNTRLLQVEKDCDNVLTHEEGVLHTALQVHKVVGSGSMEVWNCKKTLNSVKNKRRKRDPYSVIQRDRPPFTT